MSQNAKAQQTVSSKKSDQTVEVLYQKMGDRWFAFSLINDEVFVGSISDEELAVAQAEDARTGKCTYKIVGNS